MEDKDSPKLQQLIAAFKSAEEQVQTALLETNADTVEKYKLKVDKKIDKVSVELMKKSIDWAEEDLPKAYKEGERRTDEHIGGSHGVKLGAISDTAIETPYIELARHTQYANDYEKSIIQNAINEAEQDGYGATVGKVKDIIQNTLAENNASMIIQYANGTKMPLDKYAEMLARTSRIETANTGSFDRARRNGIDLVRCTKVPNCCPYCQMYEDKVYSLSGRDTRFPSLYDTALQKGYNIMHPNCRHEFIPFVEELYAQAELSELMEKSNHFKELSSDDRLFKIYNRNQALLRQWNEERHEFNKLKATLGDNMPYKTLGGFRRAKRSKSENYLQIHKNVTELEGVKNDDKVLAFYGRKGYNKEKTIEQITDLNRQYLEQVEKKDIKDVGFKAFAKTFVSASDRLIGQTTSDGREIKGIRIHFVERLFGDGTTAHKPVHLNKAVSAITNGQIVRVRKDEIVYKKNDVRVSFNTRTGFIIQCNINTGNKNGKN